MSILPKNGRQRLQSDRHWIVTRLVGAGFGRILVASHHWRIEGSIGVVPKGMERSLGPVHGRHAGIREERHRHRQLWDAKYKIRKKFGTT